MTAGALPDSRSVAPLYDNKKKGIPPGNRWFVELIGVQRDHDRKYWYYKYFPISCDFCIEFRSFTTK